MSRLGKTPMAIPKGTEVKVTPEGLVTVKGPKGQLSLQVPSGIQVKVEAGNVLVLGEKEKLPIYSFHGLFRALVRNMLEGTTQGFAKQLILIGVGFRAAVKGNKLDLQLGFSHPVQLDIPKELQIAIEKSTEITITGCDRQIVGQFAATIRAVRPPEPYKGKGVRYKDEYVRKKAGKEAKGQQNG